MKRAIPILLLALSAMAQQPRIANAKMETRSAAAGLPKEFQALAGAHAEPLWMGYAVPVAPGRQTMCCNMSWDGLEGSACCGRCRLEGGSFTTLSSSDAGRVKLEAPGRFLVLYRLEEKKVEKIRTLSEDCELDAGGLPFYWFTDVRPSESVALLASLAGAAPEGGWERDIRRMQSSALAAIALHADPAADQALITAARNDKSPHVRGQALFWLAQKAGKKAAGTITEALEKDPETEVKKQAVFALSRLPKEDGVPLLIQVARTNRNPAVRRQAIFWLGQSKDPRALDFFAEVLK